MLSQLLRAVRSRFPRRQAPYRRPSFVPRLLVLEDRTVLSTLTVTNLSDTGVAGDGSLRGEIAAAAPSDTIQFAPGLKGTINLAGDLTLGSNLTLQGNRDATGSPLVTLSRGGAYNSTDLSVAAGATVSVEGLGFTGADLNAVANGGTLTLDHVRVSDNQIGFAGTRHFPTNFMGTIYNTGALTVQDSTISNNQINGLYADFSTGGAGIFNGGTLTVLRTQLVHNRAIWGTTFGGGICNIGGTATVTACTLTGNQATDGGAVYNGNSRTSGTLILSGCTVSGNSATGGGGLFSGGNTEVTASAVTGNTALDGGGGIVQGWGNLTLSGCTLAGNHAGGGLDHVGQGGGLWVRSSAKVVTITDCTIANNTAVGSVYLGKFIPGAGGGIYVMGMPRPSSFFVISVVASTVAGNRTDGSGGGLYVGSNVQVTLTSTLVATNTAVVAPDIAGTLASASSYNLVGNGAGSSGLVNGTQGNQVGTSAAPIDPKLGPLQNNGGPTPTMALGAGSPALGAGAPTLLGTHDQRGVTRKGVVDVGAFQQS
jgi:hypothetical protein